MEIKKNRILSVKKFLEEFTDELHPAAITDIQAYLEEEGVPGTRKTVTQDIAQLMKSGADVIRNGGRHHEYFIGARHFELPELKLLIDAVQASKLVSSKKSELVIAKLIALASYHQAGELKRQLHVKKRVKTENERAFVTIDLLYTAINSGQKIQFLYYEYDRNKKRVYKHNRHLYIFSPYDLLYNSEKYYVVGYSEKHGKVITFRVDRIAKPELLNETAVPKPEGFDIDVYTNHVFQMYGGAEIQTVTLKCKNDLMKSVIDEFGEDVDTAILDDEHFTARVDVSVSPTFFGWVVSFGGRMRVESPESVAAEFISLVRLFIDTSK
jgi:predicted DNA-binding transcriptional regulator YafY